MENKELKPRIRFKGFTHTWEQCKLEELGEIITGTTPSTNETDNYGGSYLFVGPADIKENRFIEKTITTLTKKGFDKCRKIDKNSIMFVSIGSTIGKVAQNSDIAVTNQQINSIVVDEEYNNNFIYSMLENKSYDIKKQASTQAVPIINKTNFSEIESYITNNFIEQTKIGSVLLKIDNLITLHQNKYDKLKNIKKALLEKMFPINNSNVPKIRFKGFTNTWKQRKLDDFGIATSGISIESEFVEGEKYKVISIGSYSENSTYQDQGIRAKLSDKTKKKILNKDDLTMILNDKTASGRIIGRVLIIDKSDLYVFNQRTQRIEPYCDKYDPTFLYEMLNAPQIRDKIFKQSQGNTQIYVNWSTIKEIEYMIPKLKEQIKLGHIFKQLDNLIILHENKLNKLKNIKKFLLNKMFI